MPHAKVGDARFSYFLSATRKDVVNDNQVSLLPLYILAIGAWSLQRKNEPLQSFFLCQINIELFEGFKYLSSLFHRGSSPSLLIVSVFIMFDHYIDKALLLDLVAAFIWNILKAQNYAGLLKYFFPMYLWAISFISSACDPSYSFIDINTQTQTSKSTCSKLVCTECTQFIVQCTRIKCISVRGILF